MTPPLFTPVTPSPMPFKLGLEDSIVTLGSCFSDEIGMRLENRGFSVERNPFGTLYNPASIAFSLERIIDDREISTDDLVLHEGLYHSWHHHGSFSRPTADETLSLCNARIHQAHQALLKSKLLMITFGTAWVYELAESAGSSAPCSPVSTPHSVVANCHKLPPSNFTRRMMTIDEIVSLWQPLLQKLSTFHSSLSTLFTISPIRHMADGAHSNQLSKSTLLLATQTIIQTSQHHQAIHYFPAYELMLDELRDYRFYGPDMTHPSPLAADIIYDRFQQAVMTPSTIQQAHNNAKAARRKCHVPLH